MPVSGGDTVAKNIISFGGGFLKHVNRTMLGVVKILDAEVTKNISLEDHTQEELAALGHPYASRHGSQGMPIHDPYWQIHKQSGRLLGAKVNGIKEASVYGAELSASAYVGLNETEAFYALGLIWGTSKMIPRDALSGSLLNVRDEAFGYLQENLKGMVFNFKPVETA